MTKARPMVAGQTIMATSKTVRGEFWMRADRAGEIENLFGYLLAHYSRKHKIYMHSMTVMSNHYHNIFTDLEGNASLFKQDFNAAIARHIKSRFGLGRGSIIQKDDLHLMVLLDETIYEDKHIYTITNPVCANIVARYEDYKHLVIDHRHWNQPRTFTRPFWFSKYQWPHASLTLTPVPPSFFQDNTDTQNLAHFNTLVDQAHTEYDDLRTTPARGMESTFDIPRNYSPDAHLYIPCDDPIALAPSHSEQPTIQPEPEPTPIPEHFRFYRVSGEDRGKPDFCTTDPALHSNFESRLTSWDVHYAESKAEFPDDHDICFPPGTNKLARLGVTVEPLTDDDWLNPSFYGNRFVPPFVLEVDDVAPFVDDVVAVDDG